MRLDFYDSSEQTEYPVRKETTGTRQLCRTPFNVGDRAISTFLDGRRRRAPESLASFLAVASSRNISGKKVVDAKCQAAADHGSFQLGMRAAPGYFILFNDIPSIAKRAVAIQKPPDLASFRQAEEKKKKVQR